MPHGKNLRKGRYSQSGQEYLITTVTAGHKPVFLDFWNCRLLVNALREVEDAGYGQWLAWVIMPDHFHGLFSLGERGTLSQAVGRLKGSSSLRINRRLKRRGAVWQPAFHDHVLRREEDRRAVARYIVANPLRKGLVTNVLDYPHWDSVWL